MSCVLWKYPAKKMEAINIRRALRCSLSDFKNLVREYYDGEDYDKEDILYAIQEYIDEGQQPNSRTYSKWEAIGMSIALWGSSMSDLSILSMIVRVILAMICGGTIGWDRQRSKHPAGMRTYMLVCLGACVVMITGEFLFRKYNTGDPARLGAQVISGIGFLGAGSIVISGRSKIRGLTTAAGLWTSACIGLVIGTGFLECGIVATFAVYIIVKYFKKLESRITYNDGWFSIYAQLEDVSRLTDLYDSVNGLGMKVGDVQVYSKKDELPGAVVSIQNSSGQGRDEVLTALNGIQGIIEVRYIS